MGRLEVLCRLEGDLLVLLLLLLVVVVLRVLEELFLNGAVMRLGTRVELMKHAGPWKKSVGKEDGREQKREKKVGVGGDSTSLSSLTCIAVSAPLHPGPSCMHTSTFHLPPLTKGRALDFASLCLAMLAVSPQPHILVRHPQVGNAPPYLHKLHL